MAQELREKVLGTIKKHSMLRKGDRVIVALSGGSDSTALLYLLKELEEKLEINIFAANLSHGIRGEAGERDSLFVKEMCERLNVRLFFRSADIPALSRMRSIGEEECGREERYRLFDDAAKEVGGAKIATGHHAGDNAETVLFHLFRGSAAKGLCGIPPVRGNIIRPLIYASKEEIEAYLRFRGVKWRTDLTNFENDYARNRIRNVILPEIKALFPKAEEKTARAAGFLSEDEDFLSAECERCAAVENGEINAEKFSALHPAIKRRSAVKAMKEWGVGEISAEKISAVIKIASGATGKCADLGGGVKIINDYGIVKRCAERKDDFLMEVKKGENVTVRVNGGTLELKTVDKLEKMRDNNTIAVFDADKAGDVTLRERRAGDRIAPKGMSGTKKLKQLFIDLKIPRGERDNIILAAKGEEILFVPGIRVSRIFAPDTATERFLVIKYDKE